MKRLIYLCILLMCSISISAQSADKLYDEGKKLYDQEQYKEAVPKLQAAADKGHKKAQYRLGRCYDKGYGVKENDQKAFLNPFSAPFAGYGKTFHMNFVLVGCDDYTDEENTTLRQMSKQELRQYVLEHPLEYRSLTDEEIAPNPDTHRQEQIKQ